MNENCENFKKLKELLRHVSKLLTGEGQGNIWDSFR